jgi:hypothetical protein
LHDVVKAALHPGSSPEQALRHHAQNGLFNHGVDTTNRICMGVMRSPSDQTPALTGQTPPAADSDYDSIHAAVMETVRGRWFLAEYARRNRHAETDALLKAIGRIESFVQERVQGEARIPNHEPDPAPSENNDNRPVLPGDAAASEPLVVPQERLAAAHAELMLVRDRMRDVADSLIECGAPSFLTNELKRGVDDISRIGLQLGELAELAQPVTEDVGVAAGEEASVEGVSVQDSAVQEHLAEEVLTQETEAFAEPDDSSGAVIVSTPEPQPRRDPFADIRALSDIEKIALFT